MTNWRATGVGFVSGFAVLCGLLWFIGFQETLQILGEAQLGIVLWVVFASICWLGCWGLSLREILSALDVEISISESFLLITASTFLTNITPSGEPFTALLISRSTNGRYETGFAAIASLKIINVVPTVFMAVLGVAYFGTRLASGDRRAIALSVALLSAGLLGFSLFVWRIRDRVEQFTVRLVPQVAVAVSRFVPRYDPSHEDIAMRVRGFFRSLERVASSEGTLVRAIAYSAFGWIFVTVALWLSLLALGYRTTPAVPILAIPVGTTASATPLPGGLGGTESLLVGLIVETTQLQPSSAGAAVLLHRGATYWFPVVLGAGAVGKLEGYNFGQ